MASPKLADRELVKQELGDMADALGPEGRKAFAALYHQANPNDGTREHLRESVKKAVSTLADAAVMIDATHLAPTGQSTAGKNQPPVLIYKEVDGPDGVISQPEVRRYNEATGTQYSEPAGFNNYLQFIRNEMAKELKAAQANHTDSNGNKMIDLAELTAPAPTPNMPKAGRSKGK